MKKSSKKIIVMAVLLVLIGVGVFYFLKSRQGCTGNKEDVISKIRQNYNEVNALPTYNNIQAGCQATCNKSSKSWEVICSRPSFETEYSQTEFLYTFYSGDAGGNVRKIGNYVKERNKDIVHNKWEDWKVMGEPKFGIK